MDQRAQPASGSVVLIARLREVQDLFRAQLDALPFGAFAAKFRPGVVGGALSVVFPFVFTFPTGPVNVWVTMFDESPSENAWSLVEQQKAVPRG